MTNSYTPNSSTPSTCFAPACLSSQACFPPLLEVPVLRRSVAFPLVHPFSFRESRPAFFLRRSPPLSVGRASLDRPPSRHDHSHSGNFLPVLCLSVSAFWFFLNSRAGSPSRLASFPPPRATFVITLPASNTSSILDALVLTFCLSPSEALT